MTGRRSRDKGARGEREVVDVFRSVGLDAHRAAPMQAGGVAGYPDVVVEGHPIHVEVKRTETLALPAWTRQAEADARPGEVPVVAYRRSGEAWRAVVPLDYFAALLAAADELDVTESESRGQA